MASVFSKLKQAYHLFKSVDLDQLGRLAAKVDLPEVLKNVGRLDDRQLQGLLKQLGGDGHKHKELPPVAGDFYHLNQLLTEEQRSLQLKVRAFMEEEIKPIVNRYWLKGEFP